MADAANTIILKFRPVSFSEVLGNALVVEQLAAAIRGPMCPHAFLFTGPAGVGKTSLARIIATELNAFIQEIDAASHNSVEDTRALVSNYGFTPLTMGGKSSVLCIINECHNLSDKAYEPLLAILEEPPKFLYIALTTTEPKKVKDTIQSRCYKVQLNALQQSEIEDLLKTVSDVEGWQVSDEALQAIVQASTGQPRKALSILQAGHALKTREELSKVIAGIEVAGSPLIELCQYLMKGGRSWNVVTSLLKNIDIDEDSTTIATNYVTGALIRADERQARNLWFMSEALQSPRSGYSKKANFVAAIGNIIWGASNG